MLNGLIMLHYLRLNGVSAHLNIGWGLVGCMALMSASSALPHLRRWAFHAWYCAHIVLAIATIGFAFAHSAVLILIGVSAWALDLLIRYVWMAGVSQTIQRGQS